MARNAEQNQRMRDESREQILRSAVRLFAVKGLAATKISHIAADAKISQGLVYHYFRSKEEIYVELIRHAFERMSEAALWLEAQPLTPREKITTAITRMLGSMEEHESYAWYFLLTTQASVSEAIPQEAKAVIRRESKVPYEVIERIMRAGQADGSVRVHDARELALVFWAMVRGLALYKAAHWRSFKAPALAILTSTFFTQE